ncbi:tyrosine-type recombinase/integrase [Lentibacillus sediminis]|uniref:tyrosine-type recombinase/integrase n=1 Tax=Lentibacillus sediminis TaxID=1940529 RepID=UPI000C1BF0C5|nr:site-specific integrase [Lentibacillus sediminis]
MAGSVEKRGKTSWRLEIQLGEKNEKDNYKRLRKTVQAKNKTEAKKLLTAWENEVLSGEYIEPSRMTFGSFVEEWRTKFAEGKYSNNTLVLYNTLLDDHILPVFINKRLDSILPMHITDYLKNLETTRLDGKEGGSSTSTIQKHYNVLMSIFKFAKKNYLIKNNPVENAEKPIVRYAEGEVYNSSEFKEIHRLLNKEQNRQLVLMVKLALNTGMRKGEILALQWNDVDFATNTIRIRHSLSYTKKNGYILDGTKNKQARKVGPPAKLMAELKQHILQKMQDKLAAAELWDETFGDLVFSTHGKNDKNKYILFGKPFHPNVPYRWWKRFLNRVNKEREKNNKDKLKIISFHDLRHTAATDLINKGIEPYSISARLGHSSTKVTTNIYLHYLEEADQKIAKKLDDDYI